MNQDRQLPLWDFSLRYVHLMKQLFDSGMAGEMGGGAFLTWCCLRCYSDFHTGEAYPTIDRLCQVLKQSKGTTHKHLAKLEELNFIRKEKRGKRNVYILVDKFTILEEATNADDTTIENPYIPMKFKDAMQLLGEFKNNKIQPQHLEQFGMKITMPPVIVNNFFISGDNNTVNTMQVISTTDEPTGNFEDTLSQLEAQRDAASGMERKQAEAAIRMLKSSVEIPKA